MAIRCLFYEVSMNDLHSLPEEGFLRLRQVLQIIPVSKTVWYAGIKSGLYPKSRKISRGRVAWSVKDIRTLYHTLNENKADIL